MSHRGTRNRKALGGTHGGFRFSDYVKTVPIGVSSMHSSLDYGTRSLIHTHRQRIQAAKRRGVHFSNFPTFVRATNLKTGDVGFGRTAYEALSALWAGAGMHIFNVTHKKKEREAVWAEYRARMVRI